MSRFFVVLALIPLVACTAIQDSRQSRDAEFVSLIDDTMSRWTKPYDWGSYSVEDGVVSLRGDQKWFLVSKDTYDDFVFEAEVFVPDSGNSGLQFRAHCEPNRLWGYQAEVDPSDRSWSGGLYDEGRRGWLNTLEDEAEARAAFKRGEWNRYRVKADGPHIEIWVNGVKTTDYYDTADVSGHLALQHHGEDGLVYRFRNVRVQELGSHEWRPLFTGDSFKGWHITPGGEWSIENGVITGIQQPEDPLHGLVVSDEEYDDFAVRFDFRVYEGNSGFYFRSEEVDEEVHIYGTQAEVEPNGETGGIYETGGREWLVMPDSNEVKEWLNDPGEWNEMSIVADGPRVIVHVNGHESANIEDDQIRRRGHLALQLHGDMRMHVEFKDVEMLEPVAR